MVSGGWQRDSAIHTQASLLPQTPLPSRLPHGLEQSSPCHTVGPHWWSILDTEYDMTIPGSLAIRPPHPSPLVTISSLPQSMSPFLLVSSSVSFFRLHIQGMSQDISLSLKRRLCSCFDLGFTQCHRERRRFSRLKNISIRIRRPQQSLWLHTGPQLLREHQDSPEHTCGSPSCFEDAWLQSLETLPLCFPWCQKSRVTLVCFTHPLSPLISKLCRGWENGNLRNQKNSGRPRALVSRRGRPGRGSLGEKGLTCVRGWGPLPITWNCHHLVHCPYSETKWKL